MACNAINCWTFSGLVGAFLDLMIAYLLLCGSTAAYLASKFLGLFGLSLPCPCNGLFGQTDRRNCFQSLLANDLSLRISSVHSSVRKKLPFDSISGNFYVDEDGEQDDGQSNLEKWQSRNVEMYGEASSSSWYEKKDSVGAKRGSLPKWKGFESPRHRVGLRRRKRANDRFGKFSSFSYDPLVSLTTPTGLKTSASVGSRTPVNSEDCWESSKETGLSELGSLGFQMDDGTFAEIKPMQKEVALTEFKCLTPDKYCDGSNKNAIRLLEQALEEEHAARAALYLELEKERSAAATAADEAMAMIMRLQEEKATIEMEARQYQRMIEEKSTYDAEEMNILKEIILRREREKHFLEKEVDFYKQMFLEKDQVDVDYMTATKEPKNSSIYSNEEPGLKLQQIPESVKEKEKANISSDFSEYEITSIRSPHTLVFGKELPIPELNEDAGSLNAGIKNNHALLSTSINEINQEFQEKEIASESRNLNDQERHVQSNQSTTPQVPDMHENAIDPMVEEERCGETSPYQLLMPKETEAIDETKIIFLYNNEKMEKHREDLRGSDSAIDYHVHDVHVISNEPNVNYEETGNKGGKNSKGVSSNLPRLSDNPIIGGSEIDRDRRRNSLDRSGGLPPVGPSRSKSSLPISRRNSMSAFDYERSKIDTEVGWLRERLKIVQQGREKLNFPTGHREKEQVQLQILEDIASQLREIRQLTEPGKALRQASLPAPSSKVMSKKRRWRGAPLAVLRSI